MRRGFSLVELSIVLVILGLLVGGVMAGKALIRASELRKHIAEMENLRAVMQSFREKYFYYPGDLPNAQSFWGTSSQVYNGNGNGQVDGGWEIMQSWRHLNFSGMLPGSYDGQWAPGPMPGIRVPQSALGTNLGWWLQYQPGGAVGPGYYDHIGPGQLVKTGVYISGSSSYYDDYAGAPLPEVVWQIDTKVDDGNGLSGIVETWYYASCVNLTTGTYNLSNTTTPHCWFWQKVAG